MPNLLDYEHTRVAFSWEAAQQALDGLPGGRGLNIAPEAIDRHAAGPRRDHLALRKSAEQALTEIDSVLERFGGHRLTKNPDVLGSLPVETTAAGISALAASKYVTAILEDQPISLLAGSER